MRQLTEDYIQNQCFIYFHNRYRNAGIFVSIPNDESNPVQSRRKTLTGRHKGAADVVIVLNGGKVVWVEFKLPTGRQSDAQKEFEKRITELGHVYYVCRSIENFTEICNAEIPATP
jgi:hypothetical protein